MEKELVKVGMKVVMRQDKFKAYKEKTPKLKNLFTVKRKVGTYDCNLSSEIDGIEQELLVDFSCSYFEPYEEPKEEFVYGDLISFEDVIYCVKEVNNDYIRVMQVDGIIARWLKISDVKKVYLDTSWGNKQKEKTTTYQVKDLEGNVIEEKVVEDKQEECYKDLIVNIDTLESASLKEGGEKLTTKELLALFYKKGVMLDKNEDHSPITQEFIESFGFAKESENTFTKPYGGNVFIELSFSDDCWTLELNSNKKNFVTEPSDIVFQNFTCTTQSELRFLLTKGRIDCSK